MGSVSRPEGRQGNGRHGLTASHLSRPPGEWLEGMISEGVISYAISVPVSQGRFHRDRQILAVSRVVSRKVRPACPNADTAKIVREAQMSTSITHTMAAKEEQRSMGNQQHPTHRRNAIWIGLRSARKILLLSLIVVAFSQPLVVTAAPTAAPTCDGACVLACNAKTRRCSRYPAAKLPRGYRAQEGIPPGYKLIKGNSTCDTKMCTQKRRSICSLGPVGQSVTSSER